MILNALPAKRVSGILVSIRNINPVFVFQIGTFFKREGGNCEAGRVSDPALAVRLRVRQKDFSATAAIHSVADFFIPRVSGRIFRIAPDRDRNPDILCGFVFHYETY